MNWLSQKNPKGKSVFSKEGKISMTIYLFRNVIKRSDHSNHLIPNGVGIEACVLSPRMRDVIGRADVIWSPSRELANE